MAPDLGFQRPYRRALMATYGGYEYIDAGMEALWNRHSSHRADA
jgi:hypothetical protein